MKDKKEQFLGLLREVFTAGGALMFGAFEGMPSVTGLVIACAAVVWGLIYHEGLGMLETSIRKALSAVPGFLLAFGWVQPETAPLLAAFILPLFAMIWSFNKNASVSISTEE